MSDSPPGGSGSKSGCLRIFLILLAIAAVLLVLLAAGAFFGYRHLVSTYTDDKPRALSFSTLTDKEKATVLERFQKSHGEILEGKPAEAIILDSEQLNYLVQQAVQMIIESEKSKGGASAPTIPDTQNPLVHVSINGDQLTFALSLPLDWTNYSSLKGRYLNGDISVLVKMVGNQLDLHVTEIELKGKKLPESVMADLRKENFAEKANQNPNLQKYLANVKTFEVKDSKLYIIPQNEKTVFEVPADGDPYNSGPGVIEGIERK